MATLDQFGQPISATPQRLGLSDHSIVSSSQDSASVGSVLANVTPSAIRAAFADADNGYPGRMFELALDMIETDAHLGNLEQLRRSAVVNMEFAVEPGDESSEAKLIADAWKEQWEGLEPRNIIDAMMGAIIPQWSILRIIWDTDGKRNERRQYVPQIAEEVDNRRLCWPSMAVAQPGDITRCVPSIMLDWNPSNIEPMTAGKYLWHSYRAISGRPGKMSLSRSLAVLWMMKRFSLTTLAMLLEKWGLPWPSIKYASGATDDDVRKWVAQMVKSMADRVLAIPSGAELEVHDAAATGAETPHLSMMRICDEYMSKAVIGATTITDAAANNDSVSSPTHGQVREDIRNNDAWAIAFSVKRNLMVPWTFWNYGPNAKVPKYYPNTAPKVDPASRSKVYLDAGTMSLEVESEQLYSDLRINKPKSVPQVIRLQAAGTGMTLPSFATGLGTRDSGLGADDAGTTSDVPPPVSEVTLNGAQIESAIALITQLRAGVITSTTARELLKALGIPEERVKLMVDAEDAAPKPSAAPEQDLTTADTKQI